MGISHLAYPTCNNEYTRKYLPKIITKNNEKMLCVNFLAKFRIDHIKRIFIKEKILEELEIYDIIHNGESTIVETELASFVIYESL